MRSLWLLFVLFILALPSLLLAAPPGPQGTLVGTVRTQAPAVSPSTPIKGVMVRAMRGKKVVATTKTDAAGAYKLEKLDAGTYKVRFVQNGFFEVTLNVTVQANATRTEDAYLTPELALTYVAQNPDGTRKWRIRNPHPFPVTFTWSITGTTYTGSGIATSKFLYFNTPTFPKSKKLQVFVNGLLTGERAGFNGNATPVNGFLSGTVSDIVALPLAGVSVDVTNSVTHAAVASQLTATDGTYDIELAPGTYDVSFALSGYSSETFSGLVVIAGSTTVQNAMLLAAPTQGTVAGTITNAQTNGEVDGAFVELLNGANAVVGSDTAGLNGDYAIEASAGTYSIRVTAAGYITKTETGVSVATGATTIRNVALTVAPTPTTGFFTGTVTDNTSGFPIAGVTVQVRDGTNIVIATDTTDAIQGGFDFELDPGTYTATFTKSGYVSDTVPGILVTVGQSTTINVSLTPIPPNGTLTGTVRNTSGTALAGVHVDVSNSSGSDVTDALGQYDISLPPGSYTVSFSKDGYVGVNLPAAILSAQTTTVNANLRIAKGDLVGVVTDLLGVALADVAVQQMPSGAGTLTAGNGSYDLQLPVGTHNVAFSKQWYATQTFTSIAIALDSIVTLNVSLVPSQGSLQGHVRDPHGVALSGAQVSLQRTGSATQMVRVTDSNGFYTFTGHSGPYEVTFSKTGYATVTEGAVIVPVLATATLNATLDPTTGSVSGTVYAAHFVTGVDGYPTTATTLLSGATVEVLDAGDNVIATTSTNGSGSYTVNGIVPSVVDIRFSKAGFITQTTTGIVVVAGATSPVGDVTLSPPSPGVLKGFVYDQIGNSLAGVSVNIQGAAGSGVVTSGPDGAYVAWASAGTYTVTFSKATYTTTSITDVVLSEGQVITLPATLATEPATLRVTLMDSESGGPVANAQVFIEFEDGQSEQAMTGSAGEPAIFEDQPIGMSILISAIDNSTSNSGALYVPSGLVPGPNNHVVYTGTSTPYPFEGHLVGDVTNTAGQPLENVFVELVRPGGIRVATAHTDASGHYELIDARTGTYFLLFTKSGYEPNSMSGIVIGKEDATTTQDAMLTENATVEVQVFDWSTGMAAVFATVEVSLDNGTVFSTFTDVNGYASITDLPTGVPAWIFATLQETGEFIQHRVENGFVSGLNSYTLMGTPPPPTTGVIEGFVTHAFTGGGLSDGTVTVRRDDGTVADTADFNGSYRTRQLQPGTYTLEFRRINFTPVDIPGVVVVVAQTTTVNTQMVPGSGSLSGRIAAVSGVGIPNGTITVRDGSGTSLGTSSTDIAGRFLVSKLAPGTYNIECVADTYRTQTVSGSTSLGQTADVGTITMERLKTITAVVRNEGQPYVNARVELRELGNPTLLVAQNTDANGRTTFDSPLIQLGGQYLIEVRWEHFNTVIGGQAISITHGDNLVFIDVTVPPLFVATVTDQSTGNPLPGVLIRLFNASGQALTGGATGADGTFKTSAPPGTYTARCEKDGYQTHEAQVTLANNSVTNHNVSLSSSTSVTLTVRDPQNQPVPDASVTVTYSNGAPTVTATSDANGVVTFADQPAGVSATITVTHSMGSGTSTQTFTVGAYSGTVHITATHSRVTVFVVAADGSGPVVGASVVVGSFTGTTNFDGYAVLDNVPVGPTRIDAASPDGRIGGDMYTILGIGDVIFIQVL